MKKILIVLGGGGIGDTFLWVPVLKHLPVKPDILYFSQVNDLSLFKENNLINKAFKIRTPASLLVFSLLYNKYYDVVYFNHLCEEKSLIEVLKRTAKRIITNSEGYFNLPIRTLEKKNIVLNFHDSQQNYNLVFGKTPQFKLSDFTLNSRGSKHALPDHFITIQLCAGNNRTHYKNWPLENWKMFIKEILSYYPAKKIVLLGHKSETHLAHEILNTSPEVVSLVGKTTIKDSLAIIKKSELFIGPDGSLMHVSVSCGTPSFIIWGGSSSQLYGYDAFFPKLQRILKKELGCMPCNAWINPNTTKTNNPFKCPDFICLRSLAPDTAFKELALFLEERKRWTQAERPEITF